MTGEAGLLTKWGALLAPADNNGLRYDGMKTPADKVKIDLAETRINDFTISIVTALPLYLTSSTSNSPANEGSKRKEMQWNSLRQIMFYKALPMLTVWFAVRSSARKPAFPS